MLIQPIKPTSVVFLLLAVLVCGLLTLRPIPSIYANNDTGRYVDTYHQVCRAPVSFDWSNRLTWETYNLFTIPVCLVENNTIYLFIFAIPVPLAFFMFGIWRKGSLLMACAYLFSFACFEFMTNALRQSASLFFLLAAFAYIGRTKYQLLFGVAALLLHDSSMSFIPLLLLLNYLKTNDIRLGAGFVYSLVAVGLVSLALFSLSSVYLGGEGDLGDLYDIFQHKYEDAQSVWFQFYVALPVVWIFFSRWFNDKAAISIEERIAFGYFLVIFVTAVFMFPYIPYRLAITATTLQVLLAMRNNKSARAPVWIFVGLILHFLVYAIFSANPTAVLFG